MTTQHIEIATAYTTATNTYGHHVFVIQRRPVEDKTEAGWTFDYERGERPFAFVDVPTIWGPRTQYLCCFLTGKAAAACVEECKHWYKTHTFRIKKVLAPQDVADDIERNNVWRARESQRMTDGTYTPLPWADEAWFKAKHDSLNHYAHVSMEDPGKLAFTPSNDHGTADRQQRMSPGRYLQQYFRAELDALPPVETGAVNVHGEKVTIDALNYLARTFVNTYGTPDRLMFAETADEMERVYTSGPDSCMSKDVRFYDSDEHPVRVYAAGDLKLAYIMDASDSITARALVWPEKRACGRIYGDEVALRGLLQEQGYEHFDWNSLNGARLLKIEQGHGYIMPFIDGDNTYGHHADGKHLKIGGSYEAGFTTGLDHSPEDCSCDHCGDYMDPDYSYSVRVARYDTETWCEGCYEASTFNCEYSGDVFSENVRSYELANGNYVAHYYINNYFECPVMDAWYHDDDFAGHYKDTGKPISQDAVDDPEYDLVKASDGTYWPADELPDHLKTTEEEAA